MAASTRHSQTSQPFLGLSTSTVNHPHAHAQSTMLLQETAWPLLTIFCNLAQRASRHHDAGTAAERGRCAGASYHLTVRMPHGDVAHAELQVARGRGHTKSAMILILA